MTLDEKKVALIKGMLARGDKHNDIATYFGVNQARVSEIKKGSGSGKKWKSVARAPDESLPPCGPYVVVTRADYDEKTLKAAAHQEVVRQLEQLVAALRANL